MSDPTIAELRELLAKGRRSDEIANAAWALADRLEAAEAEVARLTAALRKIAQTAHDFDQLGRYDEDHFEQLEAMADAALGQGEAMRTRFDSSTPGPWKISICMAHEGSTGGEGLIDRANADLIAAAPDLLSVAVQLATLLEQANAFIRLTSPGPGNDKMDAALAAFHDLVDVKEGT